MSEQQQIFAPDELPAVSCKCPQCKTLVTFAVDTDEKYGIPSRCPTCASDLGMLAQALKAYRDFQRAAARSGLEIRVHTKPKYSE